MALFLLPENGRKERGKISWQKQQRQQKQQKQKNFLQL